MSKQTIAPKRSKRFAFVNVYGIGWRQSSITKKDPYPQYIWSTLYQFMQLRNFGDLEENDVDFHVIMLTESKQTEKLFDCMGISYSIPKNTTKIIDALFESDFMNKESASRGKQAWPWVFYKLHAWELTQYERVLIIDWDILVRKTIVHVFETFQPPAAVKQDKEINSGFLLIEPDEVELSKMLSSISTVTGSEISTSDRLDDQSFLYFFFEGLFDFMPNAFNTFAPYLRFSPDASIIHFTVCKPYGKECWDKPLHHSIDELWKQIRLAIDEMKERNCFYPELLHMEELQNTIQDYEKMRKSPHW